MNKAFNYDTARSRPIAFTDLFAPGADPMTAVFSVVRQKLTAGAAGAHTVSVPRNSIPPPTVRRAILEIDS